MSVRPADVRDARIRSVLERWRPRLLANGVDASDFERLLAAVSDWSEWSAVWEREGERYEALAQAARAAGHVQTATDHDVRA